MNKGRAAGASTALQQELVELLFSDGTRKLAVRAPPIRPQPKPTLVDDVAHFAPTVTPRFCSPYALHYARLAAIVERAHAYLEGAKS